jgi:ubiquinone/menaquinone biosynthesis C-methylase UbiE
MSSGKSPSPYPYSAKEVYAEGQSRADYERDRFTGVLGRYRFAREQRAVIQLVDSLPSGVTFADCPCGSGRWWPVLARRASSIQAFDIAPGMRRHAAEEAKKIDLDVEVHEGDAESLPLADGSVDYVFSFALTKHLPLPVQFRVLAEFARVARRGVLSSFPVFSHLTYEIWRRRRLAESYGVLPEQLEWMAKSAGLKIQTMLKCTTPIGTERFVKFTKT